MGKAPLAYRMRPEKLEDIVGQEHIIGKDKVLYRLIKSDRLSSIILYGPPGTGKTSIAEVLSKITKYNFKKINAVTAGIGDIKSIVEENSNLLFNPSGKSILFIDEIHRFNKAQQDVLLPFVEKGEIILIGATTENPYFEINKAIISRSMVFKLNPLEKEDIVKILKRALIDERGLKEYEVKISEENLEKIAVISNGDIRSALNLLEVITINADIDKNGDIIITSEDIDKCIVEKKQYFDKSSENHYDTISALIKSIRGSDADAAVHYLARLLVSGEDVKFIARRLVISAAEDIGLANPNALVLATNGMQAVQMVGMPESRIILSEVAIYLAKSKKSNSVYLAINNAMDEVRKGEVGEIPMHIRNAPISEMKKIGYNVGYKYPHDYKDGIVEQQYLPDKLKSRKYYIDKWGNDKYE